MDALSDILALVRLKGVVYFRKEFPAPWGMEMPASTFALFHLIVRGRCVLEASGLLEAPRPLSPGDIVMFPRGDAHALSDDSASARIPGPQVMAAHINGEQAFAGAGPTTTLVCGHFEFDRGVDHPFLRDLPPLIHLQQSDPRELSWLETVTNTIIQETDSGRPGSEAVVTRLAEVLFVHVLRAQMAQAVPPNGYLAALRDNKIKKAMDIIHAGSQSRLSLDGIAQAVGMSRSAFAARFKDLVGLTPMSYLADWRMLKARDLLETTGEPIGHICEQVGYFSEAAFSRTFKRRFGRNPGAVRRAARSQPQSEEPVGGAGR